MFKMKAKVKIISNQKIDGRFNFGTIIGIALEPNGIYLSQSSEKSWLASFTAAQYKVAYVDCFTNRACTEWFQEKELEKK